jgi:hypothetical protein
MEADRNPSGINFYALLKVFHASERFFHTRWFVESLSLTQPTAENSLLCAAMYRHFRARVARLPHSGSDS